MPLWGDCGGVTVEAAIALATLLVAVFLCVGAILATITQVRCIDAAREAARLTAQGDGHRGQSIARQVAPRSAEIRVRLDGDQVVAVVRAHTPFLPVLVLHAEAIAALEPGAGS